MLIQTNISRILANQLMIKIQNINGIFYFFNFYQVLEMWDIFYTYRSF